jgi:hypothetical protein
VTVGIMTLSIVTLGIMTFIVLTLGIMTLSISTFYTQLNDAQQNGLIYDTKHYITSTVHIHVVRHYSQYGILLLYCYTVCRKS